MLRKQKNNKNEKELEPIELDISKEKDSRVTEIKRLLKIEDAKPHAKQNCTEWHFPYGTLHRDYGPAIEWNDGGRWWYKHGKLHRSNGPALEKIDGEQIWSIEGNYHREDGPAIITHRGDKFWYMNGELHREDGPAIESAGGIKTYFLRGKRLTEKRYKSKLGK